MSSNFTDHPVWASIHPVVGHVLRRHDIAPAQLGIPRFHVLPSLTVRASAEVAVWMCRHGRTLDPAVPSADVVEAWIRADRALEADPANAATLQTCQTAVLHAAQGPRTRTLADLPRRAAQVATGGASVQGSLIAMARLLAEHEAPTTLAPRLEAEVLRAEAQVAFDRYAPGTRVRTVLWRGARGSKPAGHFLVETATGYGLITKFSRRWQAVLGDGESVLASLPDRLFEAGVARFFAASQTS